MNNDNELVTHHELVDHQNDEVSLAEIVVFFIESWKQLGLGAIVSAVLCLTVVMFFGTYKVEVVVDNSSKIIDFTSWHALETRLPFLAAKILESTSAKSDEIEHLTLLSNTEWWRKNVIPVYSLSKSDTKNLASVNKELQDAEATSILYLKVTGVSANEDTAKKSAKFAADFIRNGSTYISLINLLDKYDRDARTKETELQRRITATELEIASMNRKVKGLEDLRQRFPGNAALATHQVIDPKDSGAKYLSINTQLVAIYTDINNTNEGLTRTRHEAVQQKIMRVFLDKAVLITSEQYHGFILVDKLLTIESELRKSIDINDINQLYVVDGIRADLSALRIRFDKSMEISQMVIVKPNYLIPTMLMGLGGGLVMVLFLLGRRVLINLRTK